MNVSINIKKYRKEKKMTQKALAEKANISRSYLGDLESGRYNPSLDTLRTIASALDIDINLLLTEGGATQTDNLTSKDDKDIAKRMEEIKRDLQGEDGLMFSGEPMSEEAVESLLDAMEYIVKQTKVINKKYVPKKYRNTDDN